jgi:hypothetical protein
MQPVASQRPGREDDVFVDVRPALVEVVRMPCEHHPHFARVLLQHERPGADQALLEVAVLLQHLAREDDGDRLRQVLGEEDVGRV